MKVVIHKLMKKKKVAPYTQTHTFFLFIHKMGKKNYKNTHMTNDLGVTNDNSIMNVIVKVRKKKVGSTKYWWCRHYSGDYNIISIKKLPLQRHLNLVTHAHKVRLVRHSKAKVIDHRHSKCGETTLCIIYKPSITMMLTFHNIKNNESL